MWNVNAQTIDNAEREVPEKMEMYIANHGKTLDSSIKTNAQHKMHAGTVATMTRLSQSKVMAGIVIGALARRSRRIE